MNARLSGVVVSVGIIHLSDCYTMVEVSGPLGFMVNLTDLASDCDHSSDSTHVRSAR